MNTFEVYVHILNGSECIRRLLHSEFERKWTRTFRCYVQKMSVLERFHSNFYFQNLNVLIRKRSILSFISFAVILHLSWHTLRNHVRITKTSL